MRWWAFREAVAAKASLFGDCVIALAIHKVFRHNQLRQAGRIDLAGAALMFDRITFDPNILGGRACLRGMRIPVSVIVGQIAHGASWVKHYTIRTLRQRISAKPSNTPPGGCKKKCTPPEIGYARPP
jgi:hypothetical protein